jgi:hypothetical protein
MPTLPVTTQTDTVIFDRMGVRDPRARGLAAGICKIGSFGHLLLALHESRARQATHELSRYAHLIEYARRHPLTFRNRTASAEGER